MMEPEPEQTRSEDDRRAAAILRELVWKLLLTLLVLLGLAALLGFLFEEQLQEIGAVFVDNLGGPGIMLGYFIPDAFLIPLPHEVFTGFALLGGMAFWVIVTWASVGSLAGGTLGFFIGRKLGDTAFYARRMGRRADTVNLLIDRYGVVTLVIGAVSPLPYSVTCWVCGAGGMPFSTFFPLSLVRIPRVAFYLWLVQVGFIAGG